jgi:hypothetical protein
MLIRNEDDILNIIRCDKWRMDVLHAARELDLPDWWIGSGFVRTAVWDEMYDKTDNTALPDVDVIYLDRHDLSKDTEKSYELKLTTLMPDVPWSVKNQARMHLRNNDAPYGSCAEAICYWPERASVVAVKLDRSSKLRLLAPLGVADLIAGIIRPTPRFLSKMYIFRERQAEKDWRSVWPRLRYVEE